MTEKPSGFVRQPERNRPRPPASKDRMEPTVKRPGLDSYRELFDRLQNPNGAIKIYCEVG